MWLDIFITSFTCLSMVYNENNFFFLDKIDKLKLFRHKKNLNIF